MWGEPPRNWTQEEIELLGTDRDEAIGAKIGRTAIAVRSMRAKRLIPAFGNGGETYWKRRAAIHESYRKLMAEKYK